MNRGWVILVITTAIQAMVSMALLSPVRSVPSTVILPFWMASSRLMQRIIVDLPEPEGPQMTIRSPARTSRLISVST